MFDLFGSGGHYYGIMDAQWRAMNQEEAAALQRKQISMLAQANPDVAMARNMQQYRPPVTVPAWYDGWSKAMAAEPLCNP